MGCDEDRGAARESQGTQLSGDGGPGRAVEVGGRLVREDERWLMDQSACDRDALLFTAGKLAGPAFSQRRDPERLQQLLRPLRGFVRGKPRERRLDENVLASREVWQEVRSLKNETETSGAQAPAPRQIFIRKAAAIHANLSRVRLEQTAGDREKGRLPRAARALKQHELTGLDGQRNIDERADRVAMSPPCLGDVVKLERTHERKASRGSVFRSLITGSKAATALEHANSRKTIVMSVAR